MFGRQKATLLQLRVLAGLLIVRKKTEQTFKITDLHFSPATYASLSPNQSDRSGLWKSRTVFTFLTNERESKENMIFEFITSDISFYSKNNTEMQR